MKYIDAECLRKEVKKLEKAAHKFALGCADSERRKFFEGKDFAYQYVSILIDSLQKEQSSFSSNLDEAAKEYSESLDVELQSDSPDCFEEIIPAFKAGAEWGEKNAYKAIMKKADEVRDKRFNTDYEVKIEPAAGFDFGCVNVFREGKLVGQYVEPKEEKKLPEDLEEAAKRYDEAESWRWEAPKYPRREAFEAGAKWKKEQMMKDAINIKVIESYNPTCEPNERLHGISFIYDCKNDNQYLIAGDRAKITIVKEEE